MTIILDRCDGFTGFVRKNQHRLDEHFAGYESITRRFASIPIDFDHANALRIAVDFLNHTAANFDYECLHMMVLSPTHSEIHIIEVAIVKFGFVIPLNLDADPVLEAINFVRGTVDNVFIDANLRLELPFLPTPRRERAIYRCRNFAFATAPDGDVALTNPEACEDRDDIIPFFSEVYSQNGRRVPPLVEFVILSDETREVAQTHGPDLPLYESQIQR